MPANCSGDVDTRQQLRAFNSALGGPIGTYNIYLRYDPNRDALSIVRVLHGRPMITRKLFGLTPRR